MGPSLLEVSGGPTLSWGELTGAVSAVFSLLLSLIVFLIRHGWEAEKRLMSRETLTMQSQIGEAKAEAKKANDALEAEREKRHELQRLIDGHRAHLEVLDRDVRDLGDKDDEQDGKIAKLKERLDRGGRSASTAQMAAVRDGDDSDPPPNPGPMRPRLKSQRGL